jgi:hypothetical protein
LRRACACRGRHWPRAVPPACPRTGPSSNTLSTAAPPRHRQTRARPDPGPPPPETTKKIP